MAPKAFPLSQARCAFAMLCLHLVVLCFAPTLYGLHFALAMHQAMLRMRMHMISMEGVVRFRWLVRQIHNNG